MHKVTHILGTALILLIISTSAHAARESTNGVLLAQNNCFAVGQSIARERGVTLVAAEAAVQNGRSVCKIVVLVPATNGERPKREVIYVPQ